MLKDMQDLINDLNKSNSTLDKKAVLKKYPQCQELLKWVYNPYIQFYVSSENCEKRQDLIGEAYTDLIVLLWALSSRRITGHTAISAVNGFVSANPEYKTLIYNIIDKNLKVRIDAKTINSIYPDLIPEFNVALANNFEDQADKIDFKDKWYASRKMDGVRCLAIPQDEVNWKLMSRQGKEFDTLGKVISDLEKLNLGYKYVLDGEICIVDENGNEHFDSVMKEIRRKDFTLDHPMYKIFDIIPVKDFHRGEGKELFSDRVDRMQDIKLKILSLKLGTLSIVDQIPIQDIDHLNKMSNEAEERGWEGLIIRKDDIYKGKRSNDLLKVKKMQDAEYIVQGIETGPFRVISKETGLEIEEEMLSRVNILHKGNIVGVGSGFDLEQRRLYRDHPEMIVGKTICVKYFEESKNKDGSYSLRFPIIKHIYQEGRDV
ncbi:MAG TPA: hypothetical protein P5277_05085 [Candidatus Paceibacterota bacterium]|nr:hypothetical protein [Candidatus Paceibacterota bacterium]